MASFHERLVRIFFQLTMLQLRDRRIMRIPIRVVSEPLALFVRDYEGEADELRSAGEDIVKRAVYSHRGLRKKIYHNRNSIADRSLLLAARIAFLCDCQDTNAICDLLQEIYDCEHCFSKLLAGAYYEPEFCYSETGAHALCSTIEESLGLAKFLLNHVTRGKKTFLYDGVLTRMTDIPIEDEYWGHPAVYAIAAGRPDMFLLLLQYGSTIRDDSMTEMMDVRKAMLFLWKMAHSEVIEGARRCLPIFRRASPYCCRTSVPSLRDLSKVVIRKQLNDCFQLPIGIKELGLPINIISFLNLESD